MSTTENPAAPFALQKKAALSPVTPDETAETGFVPASPTNDAVKTGQIIATVNVGSQARPRFIPPNFECIPPELKIKKNWVLWAGVWNGSKWTKRPIQISGYGASTTNSKHWSDFGDVREAYEQAAKRGYMELREKSKPIQHVAVGGVGFVFDGCPDPDGFVLAGVDFDDVISSENEIASLAQERIRRLGSYNEFSVSGSGLHVIVKAKPIASGVAHNGTELYTSGRYFTMTGRTGPEPLPVIKAEFEFAALEQELKSAHSTRVGSSSVFPFRPSLSGPSELSAGIETGSWFDQLPTEIRSEVVSYAAMHVAENSRLFDLGKHGGNYQQYFKLALAIARSEVPDAEDIFVKAASTPSDADSEEELRVFFQSCKNSGARANGIAAGTLFHIAREHGADFSQWKRGAGGCGPGVVRYEPGNEEECRRQLDLVVAADPRTYTLGESGGPLAILRIPEAHTLPSDTRWEGDLPGTTLATPADIMERAERLQWMQRAGGRGGSRLNRTSPPRGFVSDYLIQMRGRYQAPPLRAIARVPRIDDSGKIHSISGYDSKTGLFHDKSPTLNVPPKVSRDEARLSVQALLSPFAAYQFDDPAAGQAQLLAAVLTAIERPFLPVAPMIVARSSMPGTGKGLLVRSLIRLAYDTMPTLVTWGGSSEEFEKRLSALLLQSPGALSIDNANGMQIKGDLLEAILTEGSLNIRPLGVSETVKVHNRSFITLTGNNPIITGDMARRALAINILPRSADPERDRYQFDPVELIRHRRQHYLQLAFSMMRAFRLAGMPTQNLPAVGSFSEWSRKVRDLVHWLTDYDVAEGFRRNKADDPRRQGDAALLAALYGHFGTNPFKAADAIDIQRRVTDHRRAPYTSPAPTPTAQAVHEALEDVLGARDITAKVFGYWARRVKGSHTGGFMLETHHNPAANANEITVRRA